MMTSDISSVFAEHFPMKKLKLTVLSGFLAFAILSGGFFAGRVGAQSGFSGKKLKTEAAVLDFVRPYRSWGEVRKPNQALLLPAEIYNPMTAG
jgi:hypothetical protein